MSSHDREIKVTDKRMFTPDGELREEYRDVLEKATSAPPAPAPAATSTEPAEPPTPPPAAAADRQPAQREPEPPPAPDVPLDLPEDASGFGPSFYDLVAMVAEPIPIYLGDVELPNGQSAENLEMARLYIDLLDVLRQKTTGNLSVQEAAFLEDLLYRMRVRYVQKTR